MMKRFIFLLALSGGTLISCQSGQEQAAHDHEKEGMAPSSGNLAYADIDPVCDMVRDETWTDFTVSGADTVWFCAETCKEAYLANPDRYPRP